MKSVKNIVANGEIICHIISWKSSAADASKCVSACQIQHTIITHLQQTTLNTFREKRKNSTYESIIVV